MGEITMRTSQIIRPKVRYKSQCNLGISNCQLKLLTNAVRQQEQPLAVQVKRAKEKLVTPTDQTLLPCLWSLFLTKHQCRELCCQS